METLPKQHQTHSQLVREFTEESSGITLPKVPSPMNKEEVRFIVRMVISEMMELCMTVNDSVKESKEFFVECLDQCDVPKETDWKNKSNVELMAEQYDSFVDAWYYMLNTAAKKGVDLDGIFEEVHGANMAKRFPDGKFHRREDGKVLKPEGWKEPNIVGEIERQLFIGNLRKKS